MGSRERGRGEESWKLLPSVLRGPSLRGERWREGKRRDAASEMEVWWGHLLAGRQRGGTRRPTNRQKMAVDTTNKKLKVTQN